MTTETAAAPAADTTTPAQTPGDAAPAPADKEGTAASPNGDGSAAEATDGDGQAGEGQQKPKKPGGGFQRRIDELTRQREDAARDRDHWRDLAMRQSGKPAADGKQPDPDAPPSPEQFESYDKYLVALAKHDIRKENRAADEQRRRDASAERARERQQTFRERCDEAADRYEDFQEVAFDNSVQVTPAMGEVIMESDKGPDLAYWLGSHPDEASRIAKLPPLAAARELGKIEAKLSVPTPRKTTKAPDPVKTVGGKGAATKNPDDMSTEEWMRQRNQELAQRR